MGFFLSPAPLIPMVPLAPLPDNPFAPFPDMMSKLRLQKRRREKSGQDHVEINNDKKQTLEATSPSAAGFYI
jgi:hypothetical protein